VIARLLDIRSTKAEAGRFGGVVVAKDAVLIDKFARFERRRSGLSGFNSGQSDNKKQCQNGSSQKCITS
jgi:hypothetical protein